MLGFVLSCLLTLYTAVMSFEILFPFGLWVFVFEPDCLLNHNQQSAGTRPGPRHLRRTPVGEPSEESLILSTSAAPKPTAAPQEALSGTVSTKEHPKRRPGSKVTALDASIPRPEDDHGRGFGPFLEPC